MNFIIKHFCFWFDLKNRIHLSKQILFSFDSNSFRYTYVFILYRYLLIIINTHSMENQVDRSNLLEKKKKSNICICLVNKPYRTIRFNCRWFIWSFNCRWFTWSCNCLWFTWSNNCRWSTWSNNCRWSTWSNNWWTCQM